MSFHADRIRREFMRGQVEVSTVETNQKNLQLLHAIARPSRWCGDLATIITIMIITIIIIIISTWSRTYGYLNMAAIRWRSNATCIIPGSQSASALVFEEILTVQCAFSQT